MSKNLPFVYFFYSCSFMMFLSSNQWFIMWISLELNSMMFLSVLVGSKSTYELESAMTYFMIQSTASLVLVYSMFNVEIINMESISVPKVSMVMALMVKLSSVPFHSWMPPVMMSLKSNFALCLMLTMQKVMPLMILMVAKPQMSSLILICICMSAVWGPMLNFSQGMNKSILAYSSISNMAWLICASVLCQDKWMFYFLSYTILVGFLSQTLKKTLSQQNTVMQPNLIVIFIVLVSMGGLPPFLGFLPKVVILNSTLQMSLVSISMLLILSSVVDLFIYTRMSYLSLINKKTSILWMNSTAQLKYIVVMISFISFNLFIIL